MPPNPQSPLLTYAEVAERLNVPVAQVRRLVRQSRLKCMPLGHRTVRFRPSDVDAFVERLTK